jgi:folate-binding protein YgfZ
MHHEFPLATSQLKSLRTGLAVVSESATILRIEGAGALACLQGLLTCDLATSGDASLHYGAILTPKGMIVVDPWVLREGDRFTLVLPEPAREVSLQLLKRVLPPRLAQTTDLSESWGTLWVLGACALERFARANAIQLPAPSRLTPAGNALVARGSPPALSPMQALITGPRQELRVMADRAGAELVGEAELAAARVLAGWPSLGREIDERTLPQEVRYDELGAVSYVKGCYTGQETVARVHFRGHVNRMLRGIRIEGGESLREPTLKHDGREVGTVRTAIQLEDRLYALALLRREVEEGAVLESGEREATVVRLPFEID